MRLEWGSAMTTKSWTTPQKLLMPGRPGRLWDYHLIFMSSVPLRPVNNKRFLQVTSHITTNAVNMSGLMRSRQKWKIEMIPNVYVKKCEVNVKGLWRSPANMTGQLSQMWDKCFHKSPVNNQDIVMFSQMPVILAMRLDYRVQPILRSTKSSNQGSKYCLQFFHPDSQNCSKKTKSIIK